MDAAAYSSMRDLQDEHWWFVGRRDFLRRAIARHAKLPSDARIFEAGCGFGGNLPLLEEFGRVSAFEYDATARAYAASKTGVAVMPGALPDGIDIAGSDFDLIALLDVLEHIEDDTGSLKTLATGLAPGGKLLVTVPAYQWLFSKHDELHHHKRRYSKAQLERVLNDAGLSVHTIGYFNTLLFPAAVLQRLATRFGKSEATGDTLPTKPVNSLLSKIFSAESAVSSRFGLPFGLSLFAVASQTAR